MQKKEKVEKQSTTTLKSHKLKSFQGSENYTIKRHPNRKTHFTKSSRKLQLMQGLLAQGINPSMFQDITAYLCQKGWHKHITTVSLVSNIEDPITKDTIDLLKHYKNIVTIDLCRSHVNISLLKNLRELPRLKFLWILDDKLLVDMETCS